LTKVAAAAEATAVTVDRATETASDVELESAPAVTDTRPTAALASGIVRGSLGAMVAPGGRGSLGASASAIVALQRTVGNRAVTQALMRQTTTAPPVSDVEEQWRNARRALNDKATTYARKFVDRAGKDWLTDESKTLFYHLVKEYAPAYMDGWGKEWLFNTNVLQPEVVKLVRQRELVWDAPPSQANHWQAQNARWQDTSMWQIIVGPEFVRRVAAGNVEGVANDLRAAFKALDDKLLSGTTERTVQVADERLDVKSVGERDDALRIIAKLHDEYGIDLNSVHGREAMRRHHPPLGQHQEEVFADVQPIPWKYRDLVAIERATGHFAPILGARRQSSSRSGDLQEIASLAKLTTSIDKHGEKDTDTQGEAMTDMNCAVLTGIGSDAHTDWSDNAKQIEGTMTHELTHVLLSYADRDFLRATPYWRDFAERSGRRGAEAPPTRYGDWNQREDLAESVMFFFVDPDRLKNGNGAPKGTPGNACPQRFKFVQDLVNAWTKGGPH
jgi:hypothetical protein